MDYGHPLELGIALTPSLAEPCASVELARRAERLGLDLVAVPEQLQRPQDMETWTQLGWIAGQTERIRLAPTLLDTPMRHAAVLARAVASLDLLSHGRLELALGAGESVDALEEAIAILRGLWASTAPTPLHTNGVQHRVSGADRGPAPAHTVPIRVSGGAARLLELAGRLADGWVAPDTASSPEALREANQAIDAAAAAAGRDPREVRRLVTVTGRFGVRRTGFLAGPPEHWVDDLLPLVLDHGMGTLLLATDDPAAVDTFASAVAPALREAVAAERARRGGEVRTVRSLWVRRQRHPEIAYDDLPAGLAEEAVEPGDAAYARVRSTYMRGGAPGLVLRPRDVAEVAAALTWSRTQPVALSVRSGGHGVSGRSTNHGGIVIDLSHLRAIDVLDPATRRVRIEPGARWGEVAAALRPRGWALTSGDSGGVGVGGLATAGGIGFLARSQGLTIDHIRAVEMVLADGSVLRASADERPDLFWGVRGAGFTLGIVTAFEFDVDEVADIGFAHLVYDISADMAGFLQRWGAAVEASPRDTTSFLVIGRPREGQVVAQTMNVVDSDDAERILARLQPLAGVAPLIGQSAQVMPYDALVTAPPGSHHGQGEPVSRCGLLEHITPGFARQAEDLLLRGATYFFQIRSLGGATSDVAPDATAFAHRSANFQALAMSASHTRLDPVWDAMHEHFTGIYLSFDTDRRPERLLDAFPPATLARLRALKRTYDPDNVFRDNFPIEPAATTSPWRAS